MTGTPHPSRARARWIGAAIIYALGILSITATTRSNRVATIVRTVGSSSTGSEVWYVGVGDCRTQQIGPTNTSGIGSMAKNAAGALYAVNFAGDLVRIDPGSGASTAVTSISGLDHPSVRALTFDSDDNLYAVTKDPATQNHPNQLYRIDLPTGGATHVGDMRYLGIQAMATAEDGTVYVWDAGGHPWWSLGLGTVNLQTGAVTDVNLSDNYDSGTNVKPDLQTLVFMSRLYGIGNGNVYEIDPATGAWTMLCPGLTAGDGIGAEYVYIAWP